jgi:hypothetical protein
MRPAYYMAGIAGQLDAVASTLDSLLSKVKGMAERALNRFPIDK